MQDDGINDQLMDAVARHDAQTVRRLVAQGADPNHCRPCPAVMRPGGPDPTIPQPTTPLRMVMFCLSDALLEDRHRMEFADIAQVLLEHGADPKPAMEIAEWRYGPYSAQRESSAFQAVWDIIARAHAAALTR